MEKIRGRPPKQRQRIVAEAIFGAYPEASSGDISSAIESLSDFEETLDKSTVRRWRSNARKEPLTAHLNQPFSWSYLIQLNPADRNGISDDAGGYLLEMWVSLMRADGTGHPISKLLQTKRSPEFFTNRTAIWSWRVHQVAPDLSYDDIYIMACLYAHREQVAEHMDGSVGKKEEPLGLSATDLDAFLAFRPWANGRNHLEYLMALQREEFDPIDVFELETLALQATIGPEGRTARKARLESQIDARESGLKWSQLGAPSYRYKDIAFEAWVQSIGIPSNTSNTETPESLPCPYATPMELLAWAKLVGFYGLMGAQWDEGHPTDAVRYWEYYPPFKMDYQSLSRIWPLVLLDPELGLDGLNHDFFYRLKSYVPGDEGASIQKLIDNQMGLTQQHRSS